MRIQSRFSKYTEFLIRSQFEITDDERLVCGIWLRYLRQGFIFTNKRFYWNLRTLVSRNAHEPEQEIPLPPNILQKNVGNLGVELLYNNPQKRPRPSFFVLDSQIGRIKIDILGCDVDDARLLRRIFIEYIARENFPYEFLKQAPLDTAAFALTAAGDFFRARKAGYTKPTAIPAAPGEDKQYISAKRHGVQDIRTYFSARTRRRLTLSAFFHGFMRTVADLAADLLYMGAAFITAKPLLLYKSIYRQHTPFTDAVQGIGNWFFHTDTTTRRLLAEQEVRGNLADYLLYRRNYVFVILIVLFVLIKALVILTSCTGKKKIFPAVLVAVSVPLCLLIPHTFLIFLIIATGLFIAMQFAIGLGGYTLHFKILATIVALLIEYYMLHLLGYPSFVDIISALLQMLALKAKWL